MDPLPLSRKPRFTGSRAQVKMLKKKMDASKRSAQMLAVFGPIKIDFEILWLWAHKNLAGQFTYECVGF